MSYLKKMNGVVLLVLLVPMLVLSGCASGNTVGDTDLIKARKLVDYNEGK